MGKTYTMLYHKYREVVQFQELTKDTIQDKMVEIKRLSKENMTLKQILNTKESQLQRIQSNQSTENQKLKEILEKYQTLNAKHIEMETTNIQQKQQIEEL